MESRFAKAGIKQRRTYKQVRRVLDVLRIVFDQGEATIKSIHKQLELDLEIKVSVRTVRRDLDLLQATSLIVANGFIYYPVNHRPMMNDD